MTDIAHWPVYNGRERAAARRPDLETVLAYGAFALAFAVSVAFPLGIV